jgi:hypothetical protein
MLSPRRRLDKSWNIALSGSSKLLMFDANNICIDLRWILKKDYTIDNLSFVEDQLVNHYNGQNLYFYAIDGNDVMAPGLVAWIRLIQRGLSIPDNKINFISISPSLPQWQWIPYPLDAFEDLIQHLTPSDINTDTSRAKFVGILAGSRFSVSRLRLAYKLDRAFPAETFITFPAKRAQSMLHDWVSEYYQTEIDWMSQRKFDNDLNNIDSIDYRQGATNYSKIWNQFHIEIITETDDYQTEWFTDKTAKCLSTGKPFLLLSGQHSLKNLKRLGFVTFDQWIDESYDECVLPGQRINAIINSLQKLYLDPAKVSIIAEMQQNAKKNIDSYHKYVQTQIQLRTHTACHNRWQEILCHTGRQQTA